MPLTDVLIDIGVPAITIFLMVIVGLELSIADFRRLAHYPHAIIAGALAQILLLPALAGLFIWLIQPPYFIAGGLIVLSACPGGALSNFYTFLADANTALSVTLTAISTALGLFTLPIIVVTGFALFFPQESTLQIPLLATSVRLFLVLLVPIAVGMAVRSYLPALTTRCLPLLRRIGILALILLIVLICYDQADRINTGLRVTVVIAVLFVSLTLTIGYALGFVLRLPAGDCFALATEFAIRNMGIAALVAVTVLGHTEFVVFGVVYFVTEIPILLGVAMLFRSHRFVPIIHR